MAAGQLKLVNHPLQQAARQVAASMPKLDLAVGWHQPSGRGEADGEGGGQPDSSDAPQAPAARAEDAPAGDDRVGE